MKERKSDVPENPAVEPESSPQAGSEAPEPHEDAPQIVYVGPGDANAGERRVRGRFQKGVSGNPGGRPANPWKPKLLAKLHGKDGDELVRALWGAALDGDVPAAKLILEYSIGKPAMAEEDRDTLLQAGEGINPLFAIFGVKR